MSQDFDQLSQAAYSNGQPDMGALDKLWTAVFQLEKWLFISRGEMPNVRPYIGYKDEKTPMIFAFTDTDRLEDLARQQNLLNADKTIPILAIPSANIVGYLEQFAQYGVKGIWFNPNGYGFFSPLENLKAIKARVDSLNV